jgi:rod shape determining protein RodA
MAILFAYDAKWYLLPDSVVGALAAIGLGIVGVSAAETGDIGGTLLAAGGSVGVLGGLYALLFIVSRGRWVGFGDVKLGAALGLILVDWRLSALALFLANLIGCLIVIPLLAAKKVTRTSHIPFGPMLIVLSDSLCQPGVDWKVLHDYQKQRVCTLMDPTKDPLGKGFHTIQGMIAIGSGGVWGKGFMQGTQTHLEFIPERTTDFIFAGFGEEFGLVGVLGVLACFIFLVGRGLMIASEAPTLFSRLLAGSVSLIFFVYAFVNMGMVSGILPVVGVPLPFISYGGTAMVTLGMGIGILMSVAKTKRLIQS